MKNPIRNKLFRTSVLYFIFISSHFIHTISEATNPTILFRATDTDLIEFAAYAETEPAITYAQYLIKLNKKKPRPIIIQSLLKQAQQEFLSHNPNRSKKYFLKITKYLHSFDWNTEEQKIIFYSLFRLAQLEKHLQKQKLLLQEAVIFGINLNLDFQIFPPNLVKIYLQLKKQSVFISLNLKNRFPMHEVIIINGYIFLNTQKIKLPGGVYRITALSSSYKAQTQVLSLSRFMSKKLKTKALVSGSCQKPILDNIDTTVKQKKYRIIFPNFCVWNSIQNQITKQKDNIVSKQKIINTITTSPKFWRQEWFWIGATVILGTTGFIFSKNINKKAKKGNPQILKKNQTYKIKIGF